MFKSSIPLTLALVISTSAFAIDRDTKLQLGAAGVETTLGSWLIATSRKVSKKVSAKANAIRFQIEEIDSELTELQKQIAPAESESLKELEGKLREAKQEVAKMHGVVEAYTESDYEN